MKTFLAPLLLLSVVSSTIAQATVPALCFPDSTKIAFIQNTLCGGPRQLLRLCRFVTPGKPPVSCNCGNPSSAQKSFKLSDVETRDLSTFNDAWDLWTCRPNECVCSDGDVSKTVPIPGVPELRDEDLPSELEQRHLLCDALAKLPCKPRNAPTGADPACAALPARPPKVTDPRCPTGRR